MKVTVSVHAFAVSRYGCVQVDEFQLAGCEMEAREVRKLRL